MVAEQSGDDRSEEGSDDNDRDLGDNSDDDNKISTYDDEQENTNTSEQEDQSDLKEEQHQTTRIPDSMVLTSLQRSIYEKNPRITGANKIFPADNGLQ